MEEIIPNYWSYFKNLVKKWWYSTLILGILITQPIYNFVHYELNILPSLLLQISISIQYILLINYFSHSHYEKYVKNDKISYLIIFLSIISVIYNSINLFIFENNVEISNFKNQSLFCKIFMYVTFPFIWFFSKMVLFLHTSVFTSVLCEHTQELKHYSDEITTDQLFEEGNLNIFKISNSLTKIRHTLELSVQLFSNLFSYYRIVLLTRS